MGGYEKAREILTDHRDSLEKMAIALLDRETLTGLEIKEIIEGKIPPEDGIKTKVETEGTVPNVKISQKKPNDDSGDIMGGGLPDPQPA